MLARLRSKPHHGAAQRLSCLASGRRKASSCDVDVAIVGAGFSGLYMTERARQLGLSVRCMEAGSDVGGTWYWNRYPGAKCDVQSMEYCYSWCKAVNQDWNWSRRYGSQKEIQSYLRRVAEHHELLTSIEFNTRVTDARFNGTGKWHVTTCNGSSFNARYLVTAVGCLSKSNLPKIPGIGDFAGRVLHTHDWPHEGVDFSGRRVAVVGVGSSGVQCIPEIAKQASHLYVFMRTPGYVLPAKDGKACRPFQRLVKRHYEDYLDYSHRHTDSGCDMNPNPKSASQLTLEEVQAELEARYEEGGITLLGAFPDFMANTATNKLVADFLRAKMLQTVHDPEVAQALYPEHAMGCKRPTVGDGFYEAFNLPNVTLVPLKGKPIQRITAGGIVAPLGNELMVDDIVCATGFDAMTGALNDMRIVGRHGQKLVDAWSDSPKTYLGLCVAGFPNFFTITGPQSPSVLTNMVASIEQHVDWIGDCLGWMESRGKRSIEATPRAQELWVEHCNAVGDATVLGPSCVSANSWYRGANIDGKQTGTLLPYAGGLLQYRAKCDEVAAGGYEGFELV
eukprot:gb/GFBE01042585.1/.p1 GENE.gb/GFBE01042585.1/~~gb/GFBE01042585.1/.p1  ORF type:complete len:563 (+),score=82.11 gb/GFBE01042585.1/:1-1689(+)